MMVYVYNLTTQPSIVLFDPLFFVISFCSPHYTMCLYFFKAHDLFVVLQDSYHFPYCYQYLKLGQFWVKRADFEFEIVNFMLNVTILILKLSISISR